VALPYLTYYNMGHGPYFHVLGQRVKKLYDFMSDQDTNLVYLMNPPLHVSLHYMDAFMGGTCLLIQATNKLKLIELNVREQSQESNLRKVRQFSCRIAIKCVEL
jgi:hypothetical protein